jgi:putative endonuclease
MSDTRQALGRKSEALAAKYLKKLGYKFITKNYRTKLGEIDIIAKDRGTLVFVEVKARQSAQYGSPKAAVTHQKQKKISMVALAYLKSTRQMQTAARFDVVSIDYSQGRPVIEVIKNAFDLAYGTDV